MERRREMEIRCALGAGPASLVRQIARVRHMLHAIAEGNVFHEVQRALDFVHRILAPQALGIADGERRAAFPREMEIARGRRMNGMQREVVSRQP